MGSQLANAPSWASALAGFARPRIGLIVCALFLAVGIAVLDDYGLSEDAFHQRRIAEQNFAYVLGDKSALPSDFNRFYGVAFELPLLLAQRALGLLGLDDSRHIMLGRHLLTHAFFLAGGFCCFLLAHRLFGSRTLALFALLLFLLHPRLYAHSFFNSKDLPFASMFMIALFLIHQAFDRNSVRAFGLCGIGVAALANLRVFGLMLFAAVLAMRALDWLLADARRERRQILATGGMFALAGVLSLYALSPYLWRDPLEFLDMLAILSKHPNAPFELFQGEYRLQLDEPPYYIAVWLAISTPPVALLLGLAGVGALLHRAARQPGEALRSGRLRFGLLLAGCFALPMAAFAALSLNTANGWRHFYFLHAPLALLAAFGLNWLAGVFKRSPIPPASAFGLAGLGLAAVAAQMAQLHPYEHLYFNELVNRHAPEHPKSEYEMDYWDTSYREGLEWLLQRHPSQPIHVLDGDNFPNLQINLSILPEKHRRQFKWQGRVDYHVTNHQEHTWTGQAQPLFPPVIYSRKLYASRILSVAAADLSLVDPSVADRYRAIYRQLAGETPIIRSDFDLYEAGGRLFWLKEPCRPGDLRTRLKLDILPAEPADRPVSLRSRRFRPGPALRGVRFDGKCLASAALPDYPVAAIRAAQCDKFVDGKCLRPIWEQIHSFERPAS